MVKNYFKITGIVLAILFVTPSFGQANQPTPGFEIADGSFIKKFEQGEKINKEVVSKQLNNWFNLNYDHSFRQINETIDAQGIKHTSYQQLYKGFQVDQSILLTHSIKETIMSMNGRVAEFSEVDTRINITTDKAKEVAKSYLKVTNLINEYPIETVVARIPTENGIDNKLAHKVRIDSYLPFVMCNIYVDTKTGNVINKISLIAHSDISGTAQTLYSGTQTITFDSFSGSYRLRESGENGRKIETYNATDAAANYTTTGYAGSTDFTNSSTTWFDVPRFSSFTISAVAPDWWQTVSSNNLPDLYIKINDGAGQTVYTSGYFKNTNPPVTFNNLNVILTNPPYTAEVWDHDVTNGDHFGGSYAISLNQGTQSWSDSENNGSYLISMIGNPALDAHWGMEKTYDFYLNVFNRNSYDGNASTIKQYVNPPTLQSQYGNDPNNSFALPSPYNFMQYGMGDGQFMNPVVALDIVGHEYTHMVVASNGNGGLTYQGESGALNESFADIFGTCIEFNSGNDPNWLIGEGVMVSAPNLRSMSNPNSGYSPQPDTYKGKYWKSTTNVNNDNGGVHTNSGVQNFWFYLLSQGGSGTNDLGNSYSVTGIGITQARQIAYRNLMTYLVPGATYMDAYNGSLLAAQDLYGKPSAQYAAVKDAWYAVGVFINYCVGSTNLTALSGTVTDGSGTADYSDNANCKWIIRPPGATQITLTFTSFDTELNNDIVYMYDGPDDTYPLLAIWSGNTLPSVINTTPGNGGMCIKFISNSSLTAGGWSANYTSTGLTSSCSGKTILADPTGTFSNVSNSDNYVNNQLCQWLIAPPCASSVTLSFSQFSTELNYDLVLIYDDLTGTNEIARLSGTTIPSPITSTTGEMLVVFTSNYSTTLQGFSAAYTSTGSAFCSGITTLNTTDSGNLSDGSGSSNYCNNMNCTWLIQPSQATSVTLNFIAFDLQPPSSDGTSIYDAVEVYDGATTTAPLLGRFSGGKLPPSVSSSGGSMLVHFFSDLVQTGQGWSASYTSTEDSFCSGITTLTAKTGTFNDGSDTSQYSNNSHCSWLIQPANASSITLSFSTFNTELNADDVIVYDGADSTGAVLGRFSGTVIPGSVTSKNGSMFVKFLSGKSVRGEGWTANYTSSVTTGIENSLTKENIKVFPNPTDGIFIVDSEFQSAVRLQLFDLLGREVLKSHDINRGENIIDGHVLSKGMYIIRFQIADSYYAQRLVVK